MPETTAEALAPSTRIIHATFDYVGEHRTRITAWVAAIAVLAVLASGIHVVKKEERGVLTRFGKVVDAEVRPGIHYAFPIIDRAHVRKVMAHCATERGDPGRWRQRLLFDPLRRHQPLRSGSGAAIQDREPEELSLRDRRSRDRADARRARASGRHHGQDLHRPHLHQQPRRHPGQPVRRCGDYLEANDIGIELLALNIVDLRPIDETVAAFRDVSDAIAESIQTVSDANTRMERLLARSRGQADAVVTNAGIKARERRLQAVSGAKAFSDLLAAYRSQPSSVTVTRYWQRMRGIFRDATLSAVNPGGRVGHRHQHDRRVRARCRLSAV